MKIELKHLSKEELLRAIESRQYSCPKEELLIAGLRYRAQTLFEKGKHEGELSQKAFAEYKRLLSPYEGKKLTDVPIDIVKNADAAFRSFKIHLDKSNKLHNKSSNVFNQMSAITNK